MKNASILAVAALFVTVAIPVQAGWHHRHHQPYYYAYPVAPMMVVPGTAAPAPTNTDETITIESGSIRREVARIMAERAALRGAALNEQPAQPAVDMLKIQRDLEEMEARIDQKIEGVRSDLQKQIDDLRADFNARLPKGLAVPPPATRQSP